MKDPYFVYLLLCKHKVSGNIMIYCGQSNNVMRRKKEHEKKKKNYIILKVKIIATVESRKLAMHMEKYCKRLTRDEKLKLLEVENIGD